MGRRIAPRIPPGEVIVDAVLFESCVGGVAVAMTVASIFHFEFWFLWGVVLHAILVAFWRPLWILREPLGVLWGSFGDPLDVLLAAVGCLGGPLGSQGAPGTSLGASGAISGIFREIMGGLLA